MVVTRSRGGGNFPRIPFPTQRKLGGICTLAAPKAVVIMSASLKLSECTTETDLVPQGAVCVKEKMETKENRSQQQAVELRVP